YLPDCLIFQIFLNLPTKDVVQTSALSTRWTTLWKDVHGLDLDTEDFNTHETFVSFVDNFLERNRGSSIHLFKATYDSSYKPDLVNRWVDTTVRLKVEHLDVSDDLSAQDIMMNPTVYTCSSLVSLRLVGMSLPSPERVSLPSLKDIVLIVIEYTNPWALEKLISQCPVLENVSIDRIYGDGMPILRVRSQSLLSFMHYWDKNDDYEKDRIVEIDAPMLKCLRISDGGTASFIIKNQPSLVEADIDTVFSLTTEMLLQVANEIQVRDFLVGISKMFTFMDAARVKPARSTNPPSEVDRLSSLPDCLIFQIFLNLPTKDVVQTSVLSTRWTTLWKDVPGLDLDAEDFYIRETFVSFVDNFLERNHGLSIHRFKLSYDYGIPILRVHSKSLLTFMHDAGYHEDYDEEDRFVEIDAPMLKYLMISDGRTSSFIIKSPPSVVEADIDTVFNLTSERRLGIANEVQKREMVRDFLVGISKVKDMSISSSALEGTSENPKMVDLTVIARLWNLLSSLEVKPALSTNPPSEVDRLSSLPDCLIFQIFLNLPTKDVVQTSALSTRWTTLWKDVHGLDLDTEDFNTHETFVSFVDNFLERNRGSYIHLFKVTYDSSYKPDLVNRWVDTAGRLKVEHLDVSDDLSAQDIMMNPTYTNPWALEKLISQCPVLENVSIDRIYGDGMPILRGTSENYLMVGITVIARPWNLLSSLEHVDIERPLKGEALEMALVGYLLENSPNLKKLSLSLHDSLKKGKYVHKLTLSLDDAPKKEESDIFIELLNFPRLSCSCQIIIFLNLPTKDVVQTSALSTRWTTLWKDVPGLDLDAEDFYIRETFVSFVDNFLERNHGLSIHRYVLPVFRNLYTLRARFDSYMWEMLPVFLEVCPNLKTLVVGTSENPKMVDLTVIARPWNLLSSLEYVDIERPLKGEALEMTLVGYLLENLKKTKGESVHKLTLSLDDAPKKEESDIFIELLNFPRLSRSCQI
ncbi:hypothetical protein HID58_082456, partial [Brassica napus]